MKAAFALVLLVAAGCMVGLDYKRPAGGELLGPVPGSGLKASDGRSRSENRASRVAVAVATKQMSPAPGETGSSQQERSES